MPYGEFADCWTVGGMAQHTVGAVSVTQNGVLHAADEHSAAGRLRYWSQGTVARGGFHTRT